MQTWKAIPSAAYTVQPETSIADCVRAMRDHGFGSILVTDTNNSLIGIFTERDLLKWITEIQHDGYWNKPISMLMSKPVITLSIDEIDKAADIMIERNIRHLPIIYTFSNQREILAGVISMRDLLKELVAKKKIVSAQQKQYHAGMISQIDGIRHLIRKMCAHRENLSVETFQMENSSAHIQDLDYLFIDLDGIEAKKWVSFIREVNALPKHPRVFLFYDLSKHQEVELELLAKLSLSKNFSAYTKPLNIFLILN